MPNHVAAIYQAERKYSASTQRSCHYGSITIDVSIMVNDNALRIPPPPKPPLVYPLHRVFVVEGGWGVGVGGRDD